MSFIDAAEKGKSRSADSTGGDGRAVHNVV